MLKSLWILKLHMLSAGNRARLGKTGFCLLLQGEGPTILFLQKALDGMEVIGGEGANASTLLSLVQKDSLGSPVSLCRKVWCSRWVNYG